MQKSRIVSIFGAFLLCLAFLGLFSGVVAADRDEVSVDVSDPFSVSCTRFSGYTQATIRAHDTIDILEIVGLPSPVDALRAGWSITFSVDGGIERVVVRARWRGKIVERSASCK